MQRNHPRVLPIMCSLMLLGLMAPARAHTAPPAPDPVLDAAGDTAIAIVTVALLGVAAFYGFRALASACEKRRGTAFDSKMTQALVMTATAGTVFLLWRFAAPPHAAGTVPTAGHTDTPRHGGQIQAVGDNHVEAAVRPNGDIALYLMGITETIPAPVMQKTVWAQAQPYSGAAGATVMLHAAPQPGDPAGQSSVFVGELPEGVASKSITLSLVLPLPGQGQPVQFTLGRPGETHSAVPAHDTAGTRVVASKPTTDEQKLFETPGGAYTQADVAANDDTTPDIKYAGQMANHHLHPKRGTYTCPITKTQANTKFAWTVGGKRYLFCCPPCIAEFVKEAKTDPNGLRPPQEFLQR